MAVVRGAEPKRIDAVNEDRMWAKAVTEELMTRKESAWMEKWVLAAREYLNDDRGYCSFGVLEPRT